MQYVYTTILETFSTFCVTSVAWQTRRDHVSARNVVVGVVTLFISTPLLLKECIDFIRSLQKVISLSNTDQVGYWLSSGKVWLSYGPFFDLVFVV